MKKRIWSILLAASLIGSAVPAEGFGMASAAVVGAADNTSEGERSVSVRAEPDASPRQEEQIPDMSGEGWAYTAQNRTLTITDEGLVSKDYENENSVPWCDCRKGVREIQLALGQGAALTRVGDYAFYRMEAMETLVLPDTVTEFGISALADAGKWNNEVHLTIKKIGKMALYRCRALKGTVQFAASIKTLPALCLSECASLESVELPKYLSEAGNGILDGCAGLTAIHIPAALKKLPEYFMRGCSGIKEIELPETVTHIGREAFAKSGLTNIEIPASVRVIGRWAFSGMSSLKMIVIPETVQLIEGGLFENCTNLEYVEFEGKNYDTTTLQKGGIKWGGEAGGVVIDKTFAGCNDVVCICDGTTYDTLNSYQNVYDPSVWKDESSYNTYADKGWRGAIVFKPDGLQEAYRKAAADVAKLVQSDYDAGLWTAFQKVCKESAALAESGESNYEKAMNQKNARRQLLSGLKPFLKNTCDKAAALIESDYDKEAKSWWTYQDALDDAAKILASETIETVDEIINVDKKLRAAMEQLDFLPTETAVKALNQIIASARKLKAADYTKASWQALQNAIAAGEKLKAVGSISQLQAAGKQIQAAVGALVKVPAAGKVSVGKAALKKVVSRKKKTLAVQWKKVSGATGYQLQIAMNKKMSKSRKTYRINQAKTTKKTIRKLKRRKNYYVRIRAYRKVQGKLYYGKWSSRKKARIK